MTDNNITKNLVRFSIPLILTGLLQQLFTWADTLILGHANGENALAAVGATSAIMNLFVMTLIGFTAGISILAARYYGAGEKEKQAPLLGSFTILFGLFMIILSVIGELLCPQILRLMSTPDDIFAMSETYLHFVIAGVPFLTLYNTYAAVLRGHSDSRAPFLCMAGAGVGNVILDVIFVYRMGWGVAGAAAATLLTQIVSAVSVVIYTHARYEHLRFRWNRRLFDRDILRAGLVLALPITARSVVSALGSVVLQNFMNGFGTMTVAAITTAYRVDCVLLLPVINFATGISTLVSQSVGEGRPENGRKTLRSGMILMVIICAVMSVLIFFGGSTMVRLFGVTEATAVIGGRFFRRLGAFYAVFGIENALSSYLEGCGKVVFTGFASIAGLLVRIAMSYLLVGLTGNMVIAWAEIISWLFLLAVLGWRYRREIL